MSLVRGTLPISTSKFVLIILFLLIFSCAGNAGVAQHPGERGAAAINNPIQSNLSEPNITVAVNNEKRQNGSQMTSGKDPHLSVQIQSKSPLESVLIRIDGRTHRTYSPNNTNFSTTDTLSIRDGSHDVTVIATAKATTVHSVTITKDSIGPRISFKEPFTTTEFQAPNENYTLSTSNITLQGELTDQSSVRRVIVNHRYEYRFNGDQTERSRYVIDEPGDSFSQQLNLGPNRRNQTNGSNYITVEAVDVKGNRREHSFTLNISDTEPPNIDVQDTTLLYDQSAVALKIRVTDNVGVSTFGRRLGTGNKTGIQSYYSENDIYQQRQEYTTTIKLAASLARNGISLFATDIVGNNDTLDYSLAYEEFVTPEISINTETTQIFGNQTARVSGTVNQGRFSHAEIEVRTSEGILSDIIVLQTGEMTNHVEFDRFVQVDSTSATIHVRVQDVTDTEHTEKYQLSHAEPNQTPQPTPNTSTKTQTPQQPTATANKESPTSTITLQPTKSEKKPTESPSKSKQSPILTLAAEYILAILPYTIGSAIFTVVLYIIARKLISS
jgi:hypothetical protein